jgi:hypothetical protein
MKSMLALGAMALGLGIATAATAQDANGPVVVELFTSQGCSSCPPANANLAAVAERPDVLALSFGVTYWDYLGWKDTFAQPIFTDRQRNYESPLGHDGPFTPQIVVDGSADTVGNERSDVERLIAASHRAPQPRLHLAANTLTIDAGTAPAHAADVWLVRYDPRIENVPVQRGENEGRTLPHKNVVRSLTRIGAWNGSAQNIAVPQAEPGLATAVLLQAPNGGAILAATKG